MLVLVLLGIVWFVALAPLVVRKVREREVLSSVTSFSRQLSRLSGVPVHVEQVGSVPGAAIGFSAAARRLADERFGTGAPACPVPVSGGGVGVSARPLVLQVSRRTLLRRRRVVVMLAAATLVSSALGFAERPLFYLGATALVATLSYLAMLGYFHRVAVERAQKVVVLEQRREMAMALDEARVHSGGTSLASRPRVRGTGWSVPDDELIDGRELLTASR